MNIAITGAGGYVGSLLVRAHVVRGDAVRALARDPATIPALPGVTRVAADVRQQDAIPTAFFENADVLYHCAAEIRREGAMHAVNVDATRVLLERARGRVARWVQVSSLSVYGQPRTGLIDETSALRPQSTYAATKQEAEAALVESGLTYTIVRPAAVIGAAMRSRFLVAMTHAVASRRFFYVGPPGAIASVIHESNMADALLLCALRDEARQRTYNISQDCTFEELVATIADSIGVPPPRLRVPELAARLIAQIGRVLPDFPVTPARVATLTSRVRYSTARIERELGYCHRLTIADAVRAVCASYKCDSD